MTRRTLLAWILTGLSAWGAEGRAKNVILFLGDAGGIATLNAASIYGHGQPQRLFLQSLPHIGLADTSTASEWVSDSAAGMTAIVTGHKTHRGVIAQSDAAVRGQRDGAPLKTILEHAEERGLATGIITDDRITGATPAACYAHVNDRRKAGEILAQLARPRFGDGVDVVIGRRPEGAAFQEAASLLGGDVVQTLKAKGYTVGSALRDWEPSARRVVILVNESEYDIQAALRRALEVLSQNPNGYFLMVEVDLHVERLKQGLEKVLLLDRLMEQAARTAGEETLILFTADHSYDFRVVSGAKKSPLLPAELARDAGDAMDAVRLENVRRDDDHTGEEVLVAARGPGAERVRGFMPNTAVFRIMMAAYGWSVP